MELPPPLPASPTTTSTWTKLLNIFVTPGEVFEEVKASRPVYTNWLVPALIYGLVTAVAAILIASNPVMTQKVRDQQAKMLDDQVKSGKLTRAQADQQMAMIESFSGSMMKVFSAFGGFLASFVEIVWWGFLLWLIAHFGFKGRPEFMKMVEVTGLASGIAILEAIVRTLLIIISGNPFASLSLALLIKNPGPENKMIGILALANPLFVWLLAVRSIGLAKVTGVSTGKAAAWIVPIWLLQWGVAIGLGLAAQAAGKALFGR